jgi:uncharacterized phage protein (TIGR02218 family)
MPLALSETMRGLLLRKVHRFASLWRIERTDGEVFLFTDHNAPLRFTYATTEESYVPAGGFDASAREKQAGVREHNLEAVGIIADESITDDDLAAGKYQNAMIVELLVDHRHPHAGFFQKNIYYITGVTYTAEMWKAQLSGQPAWLRKDVGRVYSRDCDHVFGDEVCRYPKETLVQTASVGSVQESNRVFTAPTLDGVDGYFDYGEVVWTTGDNAGLRHEVFNSTAGGQISFALETPYAIEVGDSFEIYPGCDLRLSTCKEYDNVANFGGFPFLIGTDAMIRGPIG